TMPGKTLRLGRSACAVVGVMPKSFSFYPREAQMWTVITPDSDFVRQPWKTPAGVMGRLKAGVSRGAAEQELTAIQAGIATEKPPELMEPPSVPVVLDMQREFTWLTGRNLREGLWLLFAAVAVVLLIACVNVANLLLGRAAERQREMAIRASMGCGRRRMVRQLLTESMVLSVFGALAGVGIAAIVPRALAAWSPVTLPPGNDAAIRWPVLLFVALLAGICTLLAGVAPAWRASGTDLSTAFRAKGSQTAPLHRIGQVLVALEVGLSLMLLSTALLLTKSLMRLADTPLGFRTDHLLTARMKLAPGPEATPDTQERTAEAVLARLAAMPGVGGAALASNVEPIGSDVLAAEGRRFDAQLAAHDVATQVVSRNYLQTAELPLLAGRGFSATDTKDTQPVVLVSAALVKEYFPVGNAIGRRIKLGRPEDASAPWLTIVGVVGDVKSASVFREMGLVTNPVAYMPMAQHPREAATLLVRIPGGDSMNAAKDVERVVAETNRDLVLSDIQTVEEFLSKQNAQPRFRTVVLGGFAGMALLLAAMGTYGVLSQRVVERRLEIGIRMALGSSRGRIVSRVLREALRWTLAGMVVGEAGAFVSSRVIRGLLYETRAGDPWMLVSVVMILSATIVVASVVPAWRASQVQPMEAMRAE
ncbi:MAG TPA: FtsX-like permease family protein, partial [Acidobacteriaceae bacterium]